MKKTIFVYDEDQAKFTPYKKTRLYRPFWFVIAFLVSCLMFVGVLFFLPSDVVQSYENKKMKQALEHLLERNTILAQQAVESNKRQIEFYRALGLKINIDDTLVDIQPTILDSIPFLRPDSVLNMADVVNRQVTAYQREMEERKLKLEYLPAVSPVDYEAVRRTPKDQLKISGFGMRQHPILNTIKHHTGFDFAVPVGTPVWATADGVVEFVGANSTGYGVQIRIKHSETITTLYAHLSRVAVKRGQRVKRHDFIGRSGNTGQSSGPHLHYEVRVRDNLDSPYHAIDPLKNMKLVMDAKVRNNLDVDNPMMEEF